uniref:TAR DNA-binding protein 43 N-terminal domain-containing protein n=1 Tax=Setaria digitata TaxID=48799 RepID=A0A915PCQ8_9BILA
MEDKTRSDVRRALRIYVEPIEVELDQDDAVLITTLQSALPGAFGLYFYNEDSKATLRFDGKKLLPPGDGWKDRKYYASLGCRSFDYPFGSYANATKQFERSVNSIQRLLANPKLLGNFGQLLDLIDACKVVALLNLTSDQTNDLRGMVTVETCKLLKRAKLEKKLLFLVEASLDYNFIERSIVSSGKQSAAQRTSTFSHTKTENMEQLLNSITRHGTSERMGVKNNEQTPLEQQFVELARISTAKDSVIEQQRADIRAVNGKLEQSERSMKLVQDDLSKMMENCNAKEKELVFLRGLNREQKFMCKKVNELTSRLVDRENIIAAQKKEIEFLVRKIAGLGTEQFSSCEVCDLSTSLESTDKTTMKTLELGKGEKNQDDLEIKYTEMTTEELVDVLTRAKAQNEQLKSEMSLVAEKYQQLNEVYIAVVAENMKLMAQLALLEQGTPTNMVIKKGSRSNSDVAKIDESKCNREHLVALKRDLSVSEKRVAKLTRMVHALTESSDSELRSITQDDLFNPIMECF